MKKLVLILITIFLFVGCGGSGSTSSTQYDMWDYVASKTSKTVLLDLYTSNSTYSITGSKRSDVGFIEYTVISETSKIVNYNDEATVPLVLAGNSLSIAGKDVGRFKSIGSTLGTCKLIKHYDSLTIASTYTFSDVLEFDCVDYKEFYAKDKGNVVNYTKTTFVNGQNRRIKYNISVANNW